MARTTKRTLDRMFNKLANPAPASGILLTRAAPNPARHGPPTRSPIRAGHCSGCNVRIPLAQLQRAVAGKTIQCEHCLRALYIEAD